MAMTAIEYRVRPVTRFIVTKYEREASADLATASAIRRVTSGSNTRSTR